MYEKVLVSDVNTIDKNKSQMEQLSILSGNIVYVRSVGYDDMNRVDIKMVDYRDHRNMYKKMGKEEGQMMNIDFGESPEVLKGKYIDVYEDVYAEVVTTNRFDENVDLSTTCECRFLILFGINCRVELCSKFSNNRIIFSLSTSFCQLI